MTILADHKIQARIAQGGLVNGADQRQVGPACYEARASHIYYDLTESDQRIDASEHGTILIKPGHLVVLITQESFEIPANMLARVYSKGSLFSVGLSAVSTYADPGFMGNLGIVTQNISDKYIVLPIGEPIAKVDFSLLESPANKPYVGQHGFHTNIWPIKHHLQRVYEEVKSDSRVKNEEAEGRLIIPKAIANRISKLKSRQQIITWMLLGGILVNTTAIMVIHSSWKEIYLSIATNIISSALIAIFAWLMNRKD